MTTQPKPQTIEEMKEEFVGKFFKANVESLTNEVSEYQYRSSLVYPQDLWSWIEQKLKQVQREAFEDGETYGLLRAGWIEELDGIETERLKQKYLLNSEDEVS